MICLCALQESLRLSHLWLRFVFCADQQNASEGLTVDWPATNMRYNVVCTCGGSICAILKTWSSSGLVYKGSPFSLMCTSVSPCVERKSLPRVRMRLAWCRGLKFVKRKTLNLRCSMMCLLHYRTHHFIPRPCVYR